jgi:cytochrome b6-f complex iron-sulfur subunit
MSSINNKSDIDSAGKFSRRDFVAKTLKGIGTVAVGSFAVSVLNACSDDSSPAGPSSPSGSSIEVDLSLSENQALATVGGTLALGPNDVDRQGLLLFRESQSSVKAFSRICTHQQCTVGAFQSGISTCPCHGSQYNTSGNVVGGPAPSPLRSYSTELNQNILTISA